MAAADRIDTNVAPAAPGRGRRGATDGTVRPAARPIRRRELRHVCQLPRARTRSTTDGSGIAVATARSRAARRGSGATRHVRPTTGASCSPLPVSPRMEQGSDLIRQGLEWGAHRGPVGADEIHAAGLELGLMAGHGRPQPPADPIAHDRRPDLAADRVGDPGRVRRAVGHEPERDAARAPPGCPGEGLESCTVADAPDQAESRFRPRARRARNTARPPFVRMRRRKPWVFERLRVLG